MNPALSEIKMNKKGRGVTIIELVMVISLVGILTAAFVGLCVPEINLYFYLPERIRVQNACANLLDIIARGDDKAEGLRFAGPLPGSTSTTGSGLTAASANAGTGATSITYTYIFTDQTSHTIVLTYDQTNKIVTRSIDGAGAVPIPYYATAAAGVLFTPLENNAFFRFYDVTGTEIVVVGVFSAAQVASVYRIDVPVIASSGTGSVTGSNGKAQMKMGVELKHYTTPESPDF